MDYNTNISAETPYIDGISKGEARTRVYTDTPTGDPITLTEEAFRNLVELFRMLATTRNRSRDAQVVTLEPEMC